ncbi:MAG: phage holin family protein, partial [Anaerolineaceae bacterium]|nr:phage holin family protein [Anaerolineaceae bacterium]
ALIQPVLKLLTCPLIILTLGLFTLITNTLGFLLAGWVGKLFGVGFTVDGFWYAFLGALIVSVISLVLSGVFKDDLKPRRK